MPERGSPCRAASRARRRAFPAGPSRPRCGWHCTAALSAVFSARPVLGAGVPPLGGRSPPKGGTPACPAAGASANSSLMPMLSVPSNTSHRAGSFWLTSVKCSTGSARNSKSRQRAAARKTASTTRALGAACPGGHRRRWPARPGTGSPTGAPRACRGPKGRQTRNACHQSSGRLPAPATIPALS